MPAANEIKQRLVDTGGRMSQDLGLGRIVGQTLVYLYLTRDECSLDEICEYLQLSKASTSIAARQLERLGMIVRSWKKGDRKIYYRTADNFTKALQKGMYEYVLQKLDIVGDEIALAKEEIEQLANGNDPEILFLERRINRVNELKLKTQKIVKNPLAKILTS